MAYNPDQPRDPAGKSTGGQWTGAGAAARDAAGLLPEGWSMKVGDLDQARAFVIAREKLSPDKREYLSDHTPEEIVASGNRVFLHKDGQNGFMVSPEGDLQNLFSTNHQGQRSINLLLRDDIGVKSLDCLGSHLQILYSSVGFTTYRKEPNWTKGGPDVFFMKRGN